jgi:group II intron reverse transcriptase/maturase
MNKPNKPKKVNNLRHAEYYDMQPTFDNLFARATNGEVFSQLMDLILSRENILLAYRNMKGNDGSVTPGTDGLTIRDLQKCTPDELVRKARNITLHYNPRTVRRKEIPKPYDPSKTRPLGIPCIWDRLIQQCILQVLEPVCEAKFSDNSYGFRPNRSCEHAVAAAYKHMQLNHLQYVVEVDIKGFFDHVNHSKLIRQIWAMGIRDTKLIYIIKRILKAPIQLGNGEIVKPATGTPQGGIISPLLANICLNELDGWIESQWENNPLAQKYLIWLNPNGSLNKGNGYKAMKKTGLKEIRIIRYADDFRIFCRTREDALKTMIAVKQWLAERLHLEISAEKSRVVNLKKQYSEFLGIKMRLKQKADKAVVQSHICDKAVKRIGTAARQKMKDVVRPPKEKTAVKGLIAYNAYVMGVHNYYQMATDVGGDLALIGYQVGKIAKRLRKKLKIAPKNTCKNAIAERYGASKQLRWIKESPIAPIAYVQTKAPICKRRAVQKYTAEGRTEIHENLGVNIGMLQALLRQPLYDRNAEYADNRLSLYCAQYGKCAVTGQVFSELSDIHCHHKLPRSKGGKNKYHNLVLVREDVHILIHAKTQDTIAKYRSLLNLSSAQIRKINTLRKEAGLTPIAA